MSEPYELRPSILDQLISGSHPEIVGMPGKSQSIEQLRDSVQRNLEQILNARWRARGWPSTLAELERSVVAYGIPEFSSTSFADEGQQREFCVLIAKQLQIFEPRFLSVKVELVPNRDPSERTLHFRIDGVVRAFPSPEPVVFDTAVEQDLHSVKIEPLIR